MFYLVSHYKDISVLIVFYHDKHAQKSQTRTRSKTELWWLNLNLSKYDDFDASGFFFKKKNPANMIQISIFSKINLIHM